MKDKEELYQELKAFLNNLPEGRKEEFISIINELVEEETTDSNEKRSNILRLRDRADKSNNKRRTE
jgi:hypothetical protein